MDISALRQRIQAHPPTLLGCRGEFAVLVPMVNGPDGLSLLYEVRAAQMRQHAAEVCFPGGKMEPDESAVACALRETQEELAIPPQKIDIIGPLDFLHLRSECIMYPVLGVLSPEALSVISGNPAEVAQTFLVPVDWLKAHPPKIYNYKLKPMVDQSFPYRQVHADPTYPWTAGHMEVPVYDGLPCPLWGLTARITHHLVSDIL